MLWQALQILVWSVAFAVVFLACLGLILGPPIYGWILLKRKPDVTKRDLYQRLRAECCEISGLTKKQLDEHAQFVTDTVTTARNRPSALLIRRRIREPFAPDTTKGRQ